MGRQGSPGMEAVRSHGHTVSVRTEAWRIASGPSCAQEAQDVSQTADQRAGTMQRGPGSRVSEAVVVMPRA